MAETKTEIAQYIRKIQTLRRKKCLRWKKIYKFLRKISNRSYKIIIAFPLFIVFYYLIGSLISENIDTQTEYKLANKHLPKLETAECMSFLIKREVDTKIWTPNLPFIFPAYVLDNMPNFQTGIIKATYDTAKILRKFERNNEPQKKNIKAATELLNYPPDIWLMSKKSKLNLSPSSNSQYRKAGHELHQYSQNGAFSPLKNDFLLLLSATEDNLQNLVRKNENYQQENMLLWIDFHVDDYFYQNKGYAFALWQIYKVLGSDYKEIILQYNSYVEWTHVLSSLRKAAEFEPFIIRNGKPDSLTAPNHLLLQNFYIQRAISAIEKVHNNILKEKQNAD